MDVNYADWDAKNAYDYNQVNWLSSILNPLTGQYAGTSSSGNQTSSDGQSKVGKAIGMAASIASLFSDERVKENIEQVGELDNGLPVYKYNYKGDPRTQIGLIAQDVEKQNPSAVAETPEGIKMVNYEMAIQDEEATFAEGGYVSMPELFKALSNRGASAGNPLSFSSNSIVSQTN